MSLAPWIRSFLRYGVGYLAGSEIGEQLAADPDVVLALSVAAAAVIEGVYVLAKKRGWAT